MDQSTATPLPFLGLGSAEHLHEVAEALPDGLFTTDTQGRITYWNAAAQRITGWSREEALGKPCSLLAGDAERGCARGAGAAPGVCPLADRVRASRSCTVRTRGGATRLIVKSAVPIHSPDGALVGTLETFSDVAGMAPFAEPPRPRACPDPDGGDLAGLVGRHPAMEELYRTIGVVARSDSTVMILGESGSGKELVASAVHQLSPRARGPFVRVSCSALNENLLESELFGHVRGAFTGAVRERRGRFQEAHGGTLFLDEIGDISPVVQVKLLRVIEQREIERVGESAPMKVDVRLLCATHRDLKALVADGRFRADLYFRLNVFPLRVPPLREHRDDIGEIAERFLSTRHPAPGREGRRVGPEALRLLAAQAWPGNVRELQNVLEYAALHAGGGEILPAHLPPELRDLVRPAEGPAAGGPDAEEQERRALAAVLERHGWSRVHAAKALGVSRVTLWKRMKRLGVVPPGDGDAPVQ